jgi:hypothetical protein
MVLVKAIAVCILLGLILFFCWQSYQEREGGFPRELLEAVKGDKKLAERLLENARNRTPGKPDRWYIEKVLYDMKRDGAGGGRRR